MKRAECWMTFSQALEQYLNAREGFRAKAAGWQECPDIMREAAEHMDALTSTEEEQKPTS